MTSAGSATGPAEGGGEFPHPYVAVDVLLMSVLNDALHLALLERDLEPRGWALPGKFVQVDESIDECAANLLTDKVGLREWPELLVLRPFGDVQRDPRRRVISLPFVALIDAETLGGGGDIPLSLGVVCLLDGVAAVEVDGRPVELAFDHAAIVGEAVIELRRRLEVGDATSLRPLLPQKFSLRRLQEVHEAIAGESVNKDSFRRKMLASRLFEETGAYEENVSHRPAALYQWRDAASGGRDDGA